MTTTIRRPEKTPIDRVTWSGFKICDALRWWRPDAPESFPYCVMCKRPIRVGQRYAIGYPMAISCLPCTDVCAPVRPVASVSSDRVADRVGS